MSNLGSVWNDENNVAALKRLWGRGLSCSEIAAEIGCGLTRNAVIGKATRLGLSARRTTSTFRPPKPKHARPLTDGRCLAGVVARLNRQSEKPAPEIEPPKPEVVDIPVAQRKTLMQLNAYTCRWPVGDPGEGDFFFCGAPPAIDRPYCPAHCRMAYGVTPDGRGRRALREYRT